MFKNFIKKIIKNDITSEILAFLGALWIKIVQRTSKIKISGQVAEMKECTKNKMPIILVFWHSRSMMMTKFWREICDGKFNPVAGLTSVHRDGKLMSKILQKLGLQIVEGSSTKGGVHAFMGALRGLKNKVSLAMTPDGPKGPRQRMSEGVLYISKSSGIPIFLVAVGANKVKFFKSWDRYMLVKPFAKCEFEIAGPYYVDKNEDESEIQKKMLKMENKLNQMSIKLDEKMGHKAIYPAQIVRKQNVV